MKHCNRMLTIFVFLMLTVSICNGNGYRGFTKLDPQKCTKADARIMSQLPSDWQKYNGFVKICSLKKDNTNSNISVISIWVDEYFEARFPPPAPHQWEEFPIPVIVNGDLQIVGTLPEIYPIDDITSPIIYYGRWQGEIPTEIRIDVENPAEGGDYYYKPIIYNRNEGRYEIKNKEIIHGKRH
jgi:hypothetical protein